MEAVWFKSDHRGGLTGELPVIVCLSLGRRYVANWFEQAMVVKPRYPFERCELNCFLGFPWSPAMKQLYARGEPILRMTGVDGQHASAGFAVP